jgi:CRP/FNR family transcriptional regulator, cyclic AMP receptor protein
MVLIGAPVELWLAACHTHSVGRGGRQGFWRLLARRRLAMRAPYGLNILDNCVSCPVRGEHLFCNLTLQAAQRLNDVKSTAVYPKGAMLFIEGQQPRGVFVLCTGKVKLSTSSRDGKTIITKISDSGDVLGLNAVVSNRPYEVTAEMMEPGQANFIPRDSLLHMLKDHPEVAVKVAQQLSRNYYVAYEEIRTLGLAASPSEKFAKLLLSWSSKSAQDDGSAQVKLTLTHEEVAEIIGTTRETVSRLFSEFKKKQLMTLKGATLVIRSRIALEKIVQS